MGLLENKLRIFEFCFRCFVFIGSGLGIWVLRMDRRPDIVTYDVLRQTTTDKFPAGFNAKNAGDETVRIGRIRLLLAR